MGDRHDDETPGGTADDFAALLAASEANERQRVAAGDVVRGRVIALGAGTAFVEIGGKGEAVIDLTEFRDPTGGEAHLAIGDEVEATVVDDGRTSGTIVLKRTVGRGGHVPGELEQAMAHGIAVEGLVTGENKGGFEVQIGPVRAFCPGSQIDRRRGEAAAYIGQRLRFRVTRIDAGGRNIVVSRRVLLEDEAAEQAAATWERIHVGAVLEGRISSVQDYGAFVDLGEVEGLIHVSEIGYGRVGHPSEVLRSGQSVVVKVLKVEPAPEGGRSRVALSMRALEDDPWATAGERFPAGATVPGIVRRLENFGAFVEIAPGLDGLVHVSKLALDRRVSHPRQVVAVGDRVEVTVLAVDPGQRRLTLSMVEQARRERDTQEASARAEEQAAVDGMNRKHSLGTFGDLLAASKPGRTGK
ncbi:S1 RNA-binding domain-containing protein [Candidatus Binatia bacterium]|nr:S1 RNA-binding domain-containing protein [Candidatus Binatia bacterium]